jgi:hypothetical protein
VKKKTKSIQHARSYPVHLIRRAPMFPVKAPVHYYYKGLWKDAIAWNANDQYLVVQFMCDSTAKTATIHHTSTNIRKFNPQEYKTRAPLYVEVAKCDNLVSYEQCIMSFEMMSTQSCDKFFWYCDGKVISNKKILRLQVESTVPPKIELFCLIHNSSGFELVECIFLDSMLGDLERSQENMLQL